MHNYYPQNRRNNPQGIAKGPILAAKVQDMQIKRAGGAAADKTAMPSRSPPLLFYTRGFAAMSFPTAAVGCLIQWQPTHPSQADRSRTIDAVDPKTPPSQTVASESDIGDSVRHAACCYLAAD